MRLFVFLLASAFAWSADKYSGPIPQKSDVPFLVHADNLIPTDVSEAREEGRKDSTLAVVQGASASAKTPLAEPIFLLKTDKLVAEKLQAYRMEVRNGNREVVINSKKSKDIAKPIFLNVTRLSDGLYRIEVDQTLENGEYCLSPDGSNQTFSFQIY